MTRARNEILINHMAKYRQIPLIPFSKGEKRNPLAKPFKKTLLPLKKGGGEGFPQMPFKKIK
jgi:hypothetical protein